MSLRQPYGRSADRTAVAAVFVELTAALAAPYAPSDLAQRLVDGCVQLLDAAAAGMLLVDPGSTPKVIASSTHDAAVLELIQVETGQGPCLAAIERDEVVVVGTLSEVAAQWPAWVAGARALGFTQAYGLPLHRGGQTVGALNLFRTDTVGLSAEDLAVAHALADVATIGMLQHRAMDQAAALTSQLRRALDSRVLIEQAKGLLSERWGVGVDESFARLRRYARASSRPLSEVAQALVDGELHLDRDGPALDDRVPGAPPTVPPA